MSADVNTVVIDLPSRIRGYSVHNEDDSYTVFINARMSGNIQQETWRHELAHIENGDFDRDREEAVQRMETYAHGMKKNQT